MNTGLSSNSSRGITLQQAADNLAFEKAADYKNLLEGLERIRRKSHMRFHLPENGAVLVLIRPHGEKEFSAFHIVDRRVLSRTDFPDKPDDSMIADFSSSFSYVNVSQENSEWHASSLVEVGAHKQFTMLPVGKSTARIIDKAVRKFIKS